MPTNVSPRSSREYGKPELPDRDCIVVADSRSRGNDRKMPSRSRDEIGGEPLADLVGDLLRGAILGIAQTARAGEALFLAGDVVGHAGEGRSRHHRLVGRDFTQDVAGI